MKQLIFLFALVTLSSLTLIAQEDRFQYIPEKDDRDIATFMSMLGFDYHKFDMKTDTPAYVNVYVDEYLNDQLIDEYDHISSNKDDAPKDFFNIIFTKLDTSKFTLRIYTLSKSDSIEQVQFRIAELGLFKKLKVNKDKFDYSWKLANFDMNVGPPIQINKKIPLLYFATAVEQNIDDQTISAFCLIPNILDNRELLENQGKIDHFFEIGIELVENIE